MSTNNHKQNIEFSVSLSFCIVIVLLVVSGSTATTMAYSSDQGRSGNGSSSKSGSGASTPPSGVSSESSGSGSSGSGNSTGNSAGGVSGNTAEESGGSSGKGSSSGVSSESSGSGSSGSGNSTGNTGGTSGRSQGSSTGSGSNGRGGTEGNDTNSGPSSNEWSTHCDKQAHPSCSSLGIEAGKNAPGTICPPRHSKGFCAGYDSAAGSFTNNKNNNRHNGSSSNNNLSSSPQQAEATHCDQPGSPSCYSVGFQAGKNRAGTICPPGHSANYCSGWNVGTGSYVSTSSCAIILIKSHCSTTTVTRVSGLGTIREIAPGAPAGSHTLEYIQAFNTAAGNPYKPGTNQYQNYQSGLDDAKKAGRDCDKMDTCGGPDLLGNYVNGALHLSDEQYCGNGFGVYSSKLCKFREGCTASSLGTVICPSPEPPLPRNCSYVLGKLICRPPQSISASCQHSPFALSCLH